MNQRRKKEEYERLKGICKDMSPERATAVLGLIENASFMYALLYDLQKEIVTYGVIDDYQNGENQSGRKVSAELQAYNNTIKNYTAIIDKLGKLMPEKSTAKQTLGDALKELMGSDE